MTHDEPSRSLPAPGDGHCRHLHRRRLLAGLATGGAVAAAGCTQYLSENSADAGEGPDPVTLTTEHTCDVCGMVIPNQPGPNAELFYADREPSGHENPARFCSTWEAFQYEFERRDRGWDRGTMFVTDYSKVDYELYEAGGDTLISSHPAAEAFVTVAAVVFVAGSEVKGAMGRDLIGFSTEAHATEFANRYGGELTTAGDVTPELIAQLGQA